MNYVRLSSNLVIGTSSSPEPGSVEAPDGVAIGWQLNGQTWEKGAALIAAEAAAATLTTKRTNVTNAVSTLRSWSTDATAAVAAWDGQTQTQKNATMKTVIQRLGTFMDRFADLIEGHKL